MKNLLSYLKKYRLYIAAALTAAVVASVLSALLPSLAGSITEKIQEGLTSQPDMTGIINTTWIAVSFIAMIVFLGYAQGILMSMVSLRVTKRLRMELNNKLDRVPQSVFDGGLSGDIISRLTNDMELLSDALSGQLVNIISNTVLLVGCLIMMFATSPVLALTVVISTCIGLFAAAFFAGMGQEVYTKRQTELGLLNGMIEENLAGHLVIKAFNCEDTVCEALEKQADRLYESAWKSSFFSGLMAPMVLFCGNLSYVMVCITGALLMINSFGNTRLPSIIAFIMYAKMFSTPLAQMAASVSSLQQGLAGAERIFGFLAEKEMDMPVEESAASDRKKEYKPVRGEVVFSHVCFGYTKDEPVIRDFSRSVSPGKKIAIVGPTGAGKSTLINLLMRYYELTHGHITIDGEDITSVTRRELHDKLAIVPQDSWVFEGTVRENIIYSKENVSEKTFTDILEKCGLREFVSTLPDGADTVLSENTAISAGQKQLINIARAMIKNAPILIMDEATSSVDTRSELLIQEALDTLTYGRTSFVIAHRLNTIQNADEIYVMKDGDIVETGTHEELLDRDGVYAELYRAQFDSD